MEFRVAVGAFVAVAVLAGAVPAVSAPRPEGSPTRRLRRCRPTCASPAATEDSVSLAWTASTDNSGSIHHYVTCYSGFLIPAPGYCIWGSPVPPAKTVTGLVPGKEFTFRVKAVDAAGNESALSSPVTGSTAPDVTPPTAPANLRVTATTPSSVSLAWDRSTDGWGFGYQVLMDGEVIGTTSASWRSARVTCRPAPRTRSRSAPVTRPATCPPRATPSPSRSLRAATTTPPTTPTNLTASQPPDDFCATNNLQWNASTDDVDPQSAIEYEIYLNGTLRHVTPPGFAWASPYTFAGRTRGPSSPSTAPATARV